MTQITLINHSSQRMPRAFIQKWMLNVIAKAKRLKLIPSKSTQGELVIVFVNEREMRKLNQKFRGKDYSTDVLSFSGAQDCLGELILCPQVLRRQAKLHGLTTQLELGYYLIHGLLHLLGYDHEKGKLHAKKMFDLQDHIFYSLTKS